MRQKGAECPYKSQTEEGQTVFKQLIRIQANSCALLKKSPDRKGGINGHYIRNRHYIKRTY